MAKPLLPRLLALLLVGLLGGLTAPALRGQASTSLVKLGGGELSASVLEGDAIFIFFATWSPRCRDIVARANAVDASWGERIPVMLVDFQEDEEEVRAFLNDEEVRPEVFLDRRGSFSKQHAVTTLPGLLVVQNGQVAFRGRLPDDVDAVLAPVFD